jgi:hypothetical protein
MDAKIVELQAQVVGLENIMVAMLKHSPNRYDILGDAETSTRKMFKMNEKVILESTLSEDGKTASLTVNAQLLKLSTSSIRGFLGEVNEKS